MELFNSLQAKIDSLSVERSNLQKTLTDLEADHLRLTHQLASNALTTETQLHSLNQQIDSLETTLKESIERENKLRTIARKFKDQITKFTAAAGPDAQKLAELQKANTDLTTRHQQQIQKLNNDLAAKNKELEEVRIKLSSAQEAVANAAAQSASTLSMRVGATQRLLGPVRAALGQKQQPRMEGLGRVNMLSKDLQLKEKQLQEAKAKSSVSVF